MAEPVIHVLGTLVLDTIIRIDALPGHDEKAFARSLDYVPGGPTSFVASAVAQFGLPAQVHTSLGQDDAAERIIAALGARGVDMSQVARRPGQATPSCIILLDDTGEKAIVIVPSAPGLLEGHGRDAVFGKGDMLVTHLFHPGAVERGIKATHAAQGIALVDVEWPEFQRWGEAEAMRALADADIIVTNGQFLEGHSGASSLEAAARLARDLGATRRAACVTLGGEGVVVAAEGRCVHLQAVPVTPTNTTGAGDTFIGSLAVGLARQMAPVAAVAFANQAAGRFLSGQTLDFQTIAAEAARSNMRDISL